MIQRKIVVTISVISCFFKLFAQQTPTFSEYAYNSILINSAHAGFYQGTDVTISHSSFVNDIEGTPSTNSLTINTNTKNRNIGLGLSALRDNIGVTTSTSLVASFAYKLIFDYHPNRAKWWDYNPSTLTFGISGGASWYNEDLLSLGLESDPNFAENINTVIPTIGIGALYNRNQFYVGISNTNVLGDALASNDNVRLESPNYLYGGYRIYTNRFEKLQIKPNFLLKYVLNAPLQADFNLTFNYKNFLELGAGYRTNSSINLLAVLHEKNKFKVLFSYNFPTNDNPLNNTIGILLSYRFASLESKRYN